MGGELPHVLTEIPISTIMDMHEKIGKLHGMVESISRAQEDIFDKLDAIQSQPYCVTHSAAMKKIDQGGSKIHKLEITGAVNGVKLALAVGVFSSSITLITTALVQKLLL